MHLSTHTDGIRRISTHRPVSTSRTGAVDADALGQSMQLMGAMMTYPRDAEIFGENEPADYLYKVVSGTVRTYKILNDGRRQVSGFYLPGDIFGLEFSDEHTLSAEAISDAKVLVVKRSALNALAGRHEGSISNTRRNEGKPNRSNNRSISPGKECHTSGTLDCAGAVFFTSTGTSSVAVSITCR